MTQVIMSTETKQFANLLAATEAVDELRESALAWAADYEQPLKIGAFDAEVEVQRYAGQGISETELRAIAQHYVGLPRAALPELQKAIKEKVEEARAEAAQHDLDSETPQEKRDRLINEAIEKLEKSNSTMHDAAAKGYISQEDMDKSDKELAAIKDLQEKLAKMEEGEEKNKETKRLAQMIIDHAKNDAKLIEQAIKQAQEAGDYPMVEALKEAQKNNADAAKDGKGIIANIQENNQVKQEEVDKASNTLSDDDDISAFVKKGNATAKTKNDENLETGNLTPSIGSDGKNNAIQTGRS